MGQKRRQLREELERREKGVTGSGESTANGRGSLGAGGEAMLVAELKKQGEEMRKQQGRERERRNREQKAAMDLERARKRSTPTVASKHDDANLEERTVRVKWSTKKESHSDHTLDVLFSKLGTVESITIEVGSGNKALVTFASSDAADSAVATYNEDHKTIRASYVGKKKRARRSSFAPRREKTPQTGRSPDLSRSGDAAEGIGTPASLRDKESVVMMKLRREAERQAIIRQMAADEGISLQQAGGTSLSSPAVAATPPSKITYKYTPSSSSSVTGTQEETNGTREGPEGGGVNGGDTGAVGEGLCVDDLCVASTVENIALDERSSPVQPLFSSAITGIASCSPPSRFACSGSPSPTLSVAAVQRRESDILSAMLRGTSSSIPRTPVSSVGGVDVVEGDATTPMVASTGKKKIKSGSPVDEGDILA